MQPKELLIRCLLKQEDGLWLAICLPYNLAAQAETEAEARSKLEAQILSYLRDAFGRHREHADYLLSRRAPVRYWAEYAFAVAKQAVREARAGSVRGYREVMPVALAC